MLEEQRRVLKENSEVLANLLTEENASCLLNYFFKLGTLSKTDRDSILSEKSGSPNRIGLINVLADKDELSTDSLLTAFSATANLSAIMKINNLLSFRSTDVTWKDYDGSGDKPEDVSVCATSLVDEVVAKAEETASLIMLAKEESLKELAQTLKMKSEVLQDN